MVNVLDYLLGKLWGSRLVRFGTVAVTCTLIQEVILVVLTHNGVSSALANAVGFVLSAQINFMLSSALTWRGHNVQQTRMALAIRWLQFNGAAMVALAANVIVFAVTCACLFPFIPAGIRALLSAHALLYPPASLLGAVVGSALSFAINHFVTFRRTKTEETDMVIMAKHRKEDRPHQMSGVALRRVRTDGVAFFMPAYNEAANLPKVVGSIVAYFRSLGCPFTVIIVNDGSTKDDTYGVAEDLAQQYRGEVIAVHHEINRGYGGALKTGIKTALKTGHKLIGFCDSDGQFDIADFGKLMYALVHKRAHLSVGYRRGRLQADGVKRYLMGRAWHWLSSLLLGFRSLRDVGLIFGIGVARDTDCGFKLFTYEMLSVIGPQLLGEYAVVSPEILRRARLAGFRMTQVGLRHLARTHGSQTGANRSVVLNSLRQLRALRRVLAQEGA